jgi:histidinol-phosphate phosphatase family protein
MLPAVFLDRDDTLMAARSLPAPPPPAAPGDVCDPHLVQLMPGALEGCRLLKSEGLALVVVSNQGVVARGGASEAQVMAINARLSQLLRAGDGAGEPLIDAFYFCPYHPSGNLPQYTREHPWRKPAPGMILAAAEDLDLDLSRSWLIGDAQRDVEAGIAAGLPPDRCVRIGPGTAHATVLDAARAIVQMLDESQRHG